MLKSKDDSYKRYNNHSQISILNKLLIKRWGGGYSLYGIYYICSGIFQSNKSNDFHTHKKIPLHESNCCDS